MYFVAVSFSDTKIRELFDLMRLVAEPDYARSAHITLRGPYKQKKDISDSIFRKDVGKITLRKPGCFFENNQNTVFLNIEIFAISDGWWKPDFPNVTPHLTIYDGKDRETAWVIFNTLKTFSWQIRLNSSPMHILDKKRTIENEFLTQYDKVSRTVSDVMGKDITPQEMRNLSLFDRVGVIKNVCQRINTLSNDS